MRSRPDIFLKRVARLLFGGALIFTAFPLLAQEPTAPQSRDALVPASMGVRTDKAGNSWDIAADGSIGRVGSNMVNHGLALEINGQELVPFQPLMTADGAEVVVFGQALADLPGVEVQRRVRLLGDAGVLRYVEFFYNGSSRDVVLDVFLKTNFSGNYQTFISNRGRTEPVILDDSETGIVVSPGPGQANRAFLFSLAGQGNPVRPGISSQNRFGLTFQYRLRLESGESASLLHGVAQVPIPQNFDRQSLLSLFEPVSLDALTGQASGEEWYDFLVNVGGSVEQDREARGGVEGLGVERGLRDILAIGEKTRLVGTAEGREISANGPYGEVSVPLSSVAAIVGKQGALSGLPRIFLRDGQIFSGDIALSGLSFTQAGGGRVDIQVDSLDRLVMGNTEADVDWRKSGLAMIETFSGDRLRVADSSALKLTGVTPWGELPVSLDDLTWLGPAGENSAGHLVELLDGTRCRVFLGGSEVPFESELLGNVVLNPRDLREVTTLNDRKQPSRMLDAGMKAVARIGGGQVIVGDIGNTTLPIISDGVLIETDTSRIRQIKRVEGPAIGAGGMPERVPAFEILRWDGGVVRGFVRLDELSMEVSGRNWKIPLEDIERIETPWPLPDKESLKAIKNLISLLGAREWLVREKATRELGALGYLARPVLQRELTVTSDPEVSRRLERILSNLN